MSWNTEILDTLRKQREAAENGGGPERIQKQHNAGKMTARERLEFLFDRNSFVELGSLMKSRCTDFGMDKRSIPGDGVVVGFGQVNGRLVFAASQDFTVIGGTLGEAHASKICHAMDMALDMRAPFISINDSGGARIEEGIDSLNGYSGVFMRNTRASGVIPQISVILGPCAGGACYSPAITDFIFMSRGSGSMFITGPQVVKAVTGETVTAENLGGADIHSKISGVAHFVYDDDRQCLENVKKLLSYLPQSNASDTLPCERGLAAPRTDFRDIVPDNQKKGYDVRRVIGGLVDKGSFFEVQPQFAPNIVIGMSRIDGKTVGIVANQPSYLGGAMDSNASDKAARFVRFCDCFNIPLLTLVDVTGFLPGKTQEHGGIIRHGAKLLYAFSEATVPKVCLILRKAFGGAYIAMNSKNLGADLVFAWPTAQVAVMGAEGAVDIIFKKQINQSENPQQARQDYLDLYENTFMTPYMAANRGYVDDIILPEETRQRLIQAFLMLEKKEKTVLQKKHGNMPL